MDIVVLAGGLSTERDVSLVTGDMVSKALRSKDHRVILLDVFMGYREKEEDVSAIFDHSEEASLHVGEITETAPDLEAVKKSRADQSEVFFGPNVIAICRLADVVFMALHGENGENGKVQAAFDLFGIRYTGTGYLGSALAMDKQIAKRFFQEYGIPTPRGIAMRKEDCVKDVAARGLAFPLVVKPCCGGSSIGVSIVQTQQEYQEALDEAFRWEEEVIVEEYIQGREFSVGVLDQKALPIIEIAPLQGFYDYKNKYKAGSAVETCPADLPEDVAREMQEYAVKAAEALMLGFYSRMDFLLDADGNMYCLEANTLPGMTPTSLLPQEALAEGIDFPELCERLVASTLQ